MIAYSLLIDAGRGSNKMLRGPPNVVISASVAIVIALVSGLVWLATAEEDFLPRLFLDPIHPTPLARVVTSTNTFICVFALALLYRRRRSVLDLWLIVVMCAWICELAMLDVLLYSRFTFGFYVGRGFSLITSLIVLIVLLEEMTNSMCVLPA